MCQIGIFHDLAAEEHRISDPNRFIFCGDVVHMSAMQLLMQLFEQLNTRVKITIKQHGDIFGRFAPKKAISQNGSHHKRSEPNFLRQNHIQ